LRLRAPDHQPENYRQFPNLEKRRELGNPIRILREDEDGEGAGHIAETRDHQQDAQEARDEARSNDENPERKQPQPPEDLRDEDSLAVQTEKQVRQSVPLMRVEHRQEVGASAGEVQ